MMHMAKVKKSGFTENQREINKMDTKYLHLKDPLANGLFHSTFDIRKLSPKFHPNQLPNNATLS